MCHSIWIMYECMRVELRKDNECKNFLEKVDKGRAKPGDECEHVEGEDQFEPRENPCDECVAAAKTEHPAQDGRAGLAGLAGLAVKAIDTLQKLQDAPEELDFDQLMSLREASDRACAAMHHRAFAARGVKNVGNSQVDRALKAGQKLYAAKTVVWGEFPGPDRGTVLVSQVGQRAQHDQMDQDFRDDGQTASQSSDVPRSSAIDIPPRLRSRGPTEF